MPEFIKGLELCECFFNAAAKPILERQFPGLIYSAGLLGYGSDVLGYDDPVSTDHMWGPRFYLFLQKEDLGQRDSILKAFSNNFPHNFLGYSVNFSDPDLNDGGVRHPVTTSSGPVSPLIFLYSPEEYLESYLGVSDFCQLQELDWLSFSEHKLLTLTCGKFFIDGLGLQERLSPLRFYPESVKWYLISSNWALAAEEQAFVRRCHDVGDETGSVLVCARIAERLMRLAFLYSNQYAPYSKWFGTAFSFLPVDDALKLSIQNALTATNIAQREDNLVLAQKLLADLHNSQHFADVEIQIQAYFGREIKVIFADRIAGAISRKLEGTLLGTLPRIGTFSEVANFTAFYDDPKYREQIKALYTGPGKNI